MGRACACCLTPSSSSSSRDDSFFICVLGQTVDVGPLREEKEVVVQAAWLFDNEEIKCPSDDSTQQITLTLSYNYDTEVMSYSYVYDCLQSDGETTETPNGGGGSGSGTFSIKPPMHTTIECHTEKIDLGGGLGAVWPFITCNDLIYGDDCVPVGGCQVLMKNLCLKQVKDETFCPEAGGPETPWGDADWDGKFSYFRNATGSYWTSHYTKIAIHEWQMTDGNTHPKPVFNEWGCGGCYRQKRCCDGSNLSCDTDYYFNFFNPQDWDNDKFLDITAIVYQLRPTGAGGSANIMVPKFVTYGTDVKMKWEPEGCYESLKIRNICHYVPPPPPEGEDPKTYEEFCQETCEEDPRYGCDCQGQVSRGTPMRETCKCVYYYDPDDPDLGYYYYDNEACKGNGKGHTYGCGMLDIGDMFYTGNEAFRIKVSCEVVHGPVYYLNCRYGYSSNDPDVTEADPTCMLRNFTSCMEIFDYSNDLQIRSINLNSCGGVHRPPSAPKERPDLNCNFAWGGIAGGPFGRYIYPVKYGRYMDYQDSSLEDPSCTPYCTPHNRAEGFPVTPLKRTMVPLSSLHRDFGPVWDIEDSIDENHAYAMISHGRNYAWDGTDYHHIKIMPWAEFKTDDCVEEVRAAVIDGADPDAAGYPHLMNHPTFNVYPGINFWVASWRVPCRPGFSGVQVHGWFNNFFVSWASSTGSDALCGGGGAPGGGDPGDPLEIETWDDSPQTFRWTRYEPHTETDNVTGGTKPYEASINSGTLPEGLSIDISTAGVLSISGITEAAAGPYLLTIRVLDQGGSMEITDQIIIIVQDEEDGDMEFEKWNSSQTLRNGFLNELYNTGDKVINGAAPYTEVEVITGSLPPGLSVFINDAGSVVILGMPAEVGRFQFKLRATDSRGDTCDSGTLAIEIWGTPSGGPGGGPGNPGPGDPEGIISPGETVNYAGPTITSPPQGSTARSGLRFYVDRDPDSPNSLPSGLHLNEITGAITGTFPTGEYPPKVIQLYCRVSGTAIPSTGNLTDFERPSGIATVNSGVGLNQAGGNVFRLDTMIPIEFNMKAKILPPSGNIVGAQGDSTTVWNSGDIEEGDMLLSIISDADGVPTVNLSSGWQIIIPNTGLPYPTGDRFFPSGGPPRNEYKQSLFPGLGISRPFVSGIVNNEPRITGVTTPSGLWPTGYATVALYKIATTGDAAYGTAHSQTVGAGLISSIGFRKPSGAGLYDEIPKTIRYTHDQDAFEIDVRRPPLFATGASHTSLVKLDPTSGTLIPGSGRLIIPNVHLGQYPFQIYKPHVGELERGGRPVSTGVGPWSSIIRENDTILTPDSGTTAIYIWTAKSTTAFQTNGPSGVMSKEFTLNKRGTSAGTFPGFTNPLSMMIAVSQYSFVRPSSVSPLAGSPTGCNTLVLEF